ncbi:MAG: cyclomaltodextrinase N-terminal domain-containing protein, partial [Bacteroidota bacterium]|nr:cyclomaltodextrinase N-terminal domain-containing protein [Bacteroidota bacterium]MDX5431483.1 cyclomaltodextrinase N-terminal domain-containing protein [Bacteroidota bacterium]MDX5470207.1 cyclomaltodextrinase N-terminal domain-containing protein [Bacteroidota bacterium]
QLILQGPKIGQSQEWVSQNDLLEIQEIIPYSNPDYLILHLKMKKEAKAGHYSFSYRLGKRKKTYTYELKARPATKARALNQRDIVYLLMPDRFANGEPDNDYPSGMLEKRNSPDSSFGRHGGDIKGVIKQLDYLQNLGITSLWLNPVFENNEILESYHGYAITDHYRVDPRLGDFSDYEKLSEALHQRNMKLVKDVVFNHIGIHHSFFQNLIDSSWFNWWDGFQKTSYRAPTGFDPYASPSDQKIFEKGWFDHHMPDLNTRNPEVRRYLYQYALWWAIRFDLDGLRIDTYAYPDEECMQGLLSYLHQELPQLSIFAEVWEHGVGVQSYYARGNALHSGFAMIDFQLCFAIQRCMNDPVGWTEGVSSLYYTLSQDYLYPKGNPSQMLTFIDNHDLPRALGVFGGDLTKLHGALKLLYVMRGIPSILYGTEQLQASTGSDDLKRQAWKGGWPGQAAPETYEDSATAKLLRSLAALRREHAAFDDNATQMQYIPQQGKYVYFRERDGHGIALLCNTANQRTEFRLADYPELYDALGGAEYSVLEVANLKGNRNAVFGLEHHETVVLIW